MDISKLSHGAKLVLGGSVAFLIVSFFNWQEVEFAGIASAGRSMWSGIGVIAGLLAIGLIVWEGLRLANMKIEIGLSPAMVSAALAVLLAIFTVLKFLTDNEFRTFWAWLGLVLAILIAVGAYLNMKETGMSIADMKQQVTGAAASATAAAKSATDSVGDKTSSAADTTQETASDAGYAGRDAVDEDDKPSTPSSTV